MILLLILVLMLALLIGVSIAVISVTGAIGVIIFGDVIVCIVLILWFIKRILRKRK
nr:hypothetical protein [uncultured Mediterraneibacter sp.]